MEHKKIIVIGNQVSELELVEEVIRHVEPLSQCVGFVFGDEALRMINTEMVQPPTHIFINANVKRVSISNCLNALRDNPQLDTCCITVFSDTMPVTLAEAYCRMGADFAFAKPATLAAGVDLLQCVIPAVRQDVDIKK